MPIDKFEPKKPDRFQFLIDAWFRNQFIEEGKATLALICYQACASYYEKTVKNGAK